MPKISFEEVQEDLKLISPQLSDAECADYANIGMMLSQKEVVDRQLARLEAASNENLEIKVRKRKKVKPDTLSLAP